MSMNKHVISDVVRIRKLSCFWTRHEARLSATLSDRGHGGVKTRERRTKNAVEQQNHPMDWFHIRRCEVIRLRQEKTEKYGH